MISLNRWRKNFFICACICIIFLGTPCLFAQDVKFFVRKIEIKGNTLLSESEIASVISGFHGRELGLLELKEASKKLTELYHKKGYILARAYVPDQNIEDGVVVFQVLQGNIGEIKIEGNKGYSSKFIRYFLSPAIKKGVLHYPNFQKALLLINEFPDIEVKSFFKEGKEAGTTDIVIQVEDKTPFHVELNYNNFGSKYQGVNRAGVDISHGNLTGRGDYMEWQMVFSFPSQQDPFITGTYIIPVSREGAKLFASYASAAVKLGRELQILEIKGGANIFGVGLTYPLFRTESEGSNISMSFYHKDIENFILGDILVSRDKLREIVLGYNASWKTNSNRRIIDVNLTQGLGTLFDGMPNDDELASRELAGNSFTKINLNAAYIMKIFTDKFLILRGQGQLAFNLLTPTEQFAIGGPDSVRGFPQSAYSGDSGWNVLIELRIPLSGKAANNIIQGALFLDAAQAFYRNPLYGQEKQQSLIGGGAGVLINLGDSTSMRIDIGIPLDPSKNSVLQNPIYYIQFSTKF